MATRNGESKRFKIEGTSFLTDAVGIELVKKVEARYVGQVRDSQIHQQMSADAQELLKTLKESGRLFHKDGYRF